MDEQDESGDPDEKTLDEGTPTFTLENIQEDGSFLDLGELDNILSRLRSRKNLILQGPPGTGKTWLAKRLGKALIGSKTPPASQLRVVQFHPSLSYEDFVRGYRPAKNKLEIRDGVLLQIVADAHSNPGTPHVLVIEEINRGNPAKILGEMLTLLESTKRHAAEAMELAYKKTEKETIFIPDNLFVIGTMNLADRSLAFVDIALRRRFAFITMGPMLNDLWAAWCLDRGFEGSDVLRIRDRISKLNEEIRSDPDLGTHFEIGHSYVTPGPEEIIRDPDRWFFDIVETELAPLLHEYWFDDPDRAEKMRERLSPTS